MIDFLDPFPLWIPVGILAFGLAIINMIRILKGKNRGWYVLLFLSLSFGLLEMLLQYYIIYRNVLDEDWSALLDVVPSMSMILTGSVFIGIGLNAFILINQLKSNRIRE